MRKRQFSSKVLKKIPELSCVNGYFYTLPVEHVLSGFLCEAKSSWDEIHQFTFPFFDRAGFLHLTYSCCISSIDYSNVPKNDLADEFVARIQPLISKAYEASSLEGFIAFLDQDDKNKSRVHPSRRTAIGYGYALLGDKDKAIAALDIAVNDHLVKLDQKVHLDCLLILTYLCNNQMIEAQKLLCDWEAETRNWLKVSTMRDSMALKVKG